jgi:hypothetical protein
MLSDKSAKNIGCVISGIFKGLKSSIVLNPCGMKNVEKNRFKGTIFMY